MSGAVFIEMPNEKPIDLVSEGKDKCFYGGSPKATPSWHFISDRYERLATRQNRLVP